VFRRNQQGFDEELQDFERGIEGIGTEVEERDAG
jgi:hypothetical protein